jgi:putative ABC transport system permease protein
VEKCTDWDSDLPINMDLITKEDEDYWAQYRTTPKAIVSYRAIYEKWGNAYGSATAIRNDKPFDTSGLDASMFGIQIIYPKELGLSAARNGVDFSSLFLSLGFFIILSAILLMLVPLLEMIYVRRNEIALLSALGYSRKRITDILWRESAPVVLVSSLIGIVVGLLYTWLILVLLGSLWKGATHTGGFVLFPNAGSILTGFVAGIAISLVLLRVAIVRALRNHALNRKIKNNPLRRKLCLALAFTLATIFSVYWAAANAISLFVVAGVLLIVTAACWGDYVVSRRGAAQSEPFHIPKLIWANLYANKKRVLLSFFTLTAGVFIVFSVGLNRRGFTDNAQLTSGTGGYSLWCESSAPIYHNIATQAGKEKLALNDLSEDTRVIQIIRYSADDAS